MPPIERGSTKLLGICEILYLSLTVLAFYLLVASRTGEAHTVWQVLHPAFIPTLFVTTSLLLAILFISGKTTHKMLLVIAHSILIHSLFSMIFPAGDLSGQQMILGRTRLVFDNTVLYNWSVWPTKTIQMFIFEMFRGVNLQAALSTIFARMLSIDVFYVHLSLVPVLWGVFVPIASFLITKTVSGSERAAVLSSLLVSAFPYTIYFGAISVPNSLGFIFFLYSLYFMLRHLSPSQSKTAYWMVAFSVFSFISHYLTGVMSVSLLLLTLAFKAYAEEKLPHSVTARASLLVTFLFCASLLPLSFIYLGLVNTAAAPVFSLDKLYELPLGEILGLFLIGELTYGFDIKTIILVTAGSLLALLWMIYLLCSLKRNPSARYRTHILFLFAAFVLMLIDYRILKIFMTRLPLNAERLWVFRDLIAAPFVALAVCAVFSALETSLKIKSMPAKITSSLMTLSKGNFLRALSLVLALNILIPALLGGWITISLSAAYTHLAPLQTTWYELDAVKYIDQNTKEEYVVIGDIWTIYAGEVIVGINNPRAYYFGEYNKTGYDLFANMRQDPSPQWMLLAMNYTNTTTAYFIVTEPRLGTEEFNRVVSKTKETLTVFHITGEGKLYVFSYKEGQGV